LNYKLRKPFDQGVIISMNQEHIAVGDAVDGVRMFVEYDEDTIVFNEKWRKTHINELKVGDFIEVHTSGEVTLELPCTFYGEVILILEKNHFVKRTQ